MKRTKKIILLLGGVLALAFNIQQAQSGGEFPIATTAGNELGLMAAFDGTNYLVGIEGDEAHHANITAQMISQTGSLVGSRISIGRTGGMPSIAFDGTNYLMVWSDDATYPNCDIYGQFIDTSGVLVGSPFPISTAAGKQEMGDIAFDGTNFLVVWTDYRSSRGDEGPRYVYGQIVSKSGSLIGPEIGISTDPGHMPAIAFDGSNYLVVWVEDTNDTDIYGQFISPSGTFEAGNFVIESNNFPSDNPISIVFDGTNYLVLFHDEINDEWDICGRSVSTSGSVGSRITISDAAGNQLFPFVDFDGTNYLVTMCDGLGGSSVAAKGKYYDINFNPVGDWFTIFEAQDSKIPIGSSVIFDGTRYLAVTMRVRAIIGGAEDWSIADGDVYGTFIEPVADSGTFVIDISPEDKFGGTSAFDGTNYLVGIEVNRGEWWDACAQMVTKAGELYGSEIVLSETSAGAGMPFIGFDGTNYLAVWNDYRNGPNSDIYGQFVSKSAALIGSNIAISTATGNQRVGNNVGFDGTDYLIVWTDDRGGDMDIYGQLVSPSGSLVGSEIAISTASYNQNDPVVAFDGTNYLVAWNDGHRLGAGGGYGEDIYGQFVDTSGALSGSNFAINENSYPSDNPLGIAFDGTNYLVTWMDEVGGASSREWDLFGQLVDTSGNPSGSVITIITAPRGQYFPRVDFDGTNYLVVWFDMRNDANNNGHYDPSEGTGSDIYGQFLDTSGTLLGSDFAITNAVNDQIVGWPCFGDTKYLVAWTDNRDGDHGLYQGFPTGDIYGVFVSQFGPTPLVSSLVGTWGYQELWHQNDGRWYTSSNRITFNSNGTGTLAYRRNTNGSLNSGTENFTYTTESNPDGTTTISYTPEGHTQAEPTRVVLSADEKVMIFDGTIDPSKQEFTVFIRIDTTKTYSNVDLSGEYYTIAYQHNAPSESPIASQGFSGIFNFSESGSFTATETVNGDGTISTDEYSDAYWINADGSSVNSDIAGTGYLTGDGKVFINPNDECTDCWGDYVGIKRQDRTYSTADLERTWAVAGFGDDNGTSFNAEFGFMTFDADGNYSYNFTNQRDGTYTTKTGAGTFSVSADGSFGESVSPGAPYYAGAIGNDGNIIIFNMSFDKSSLYHREIFIGVRVSAPPADTHGD